MGISGLSERLLASEEGFSSIELNNEDWTIYSFHSIYDVYEIHGPTKQSCCFWEEALYQVQNSRLFFDELYQQEQ
jgi:hypothetical protein